jgi:hypothetical protein
MNLAVERYTDQTTRWPEKGRHILAQFDATSIVVYQDEQLRKTLGMDLS